MIFLGAGASKPFGIPTLQKFSEDVKRILIDLGHTKLLEQIEIVLREFNMTVDFESLYSIIESLIDPIESIRKSGPSTAFYVKRRANLPRSIDFIPVLEDLKKIIYEKCYLEPEKTSLIQKIYDPLFEPEENYGAKEEYILDPHSTRSVNHIIATTNYDMSLELYFMSKDINYLDGYEGPATSVVNRFNPLLLQNPYGRARHVILKLHGSIWQFDQNGEMIKTIMDPNKAPIPIEIEKEMMIYPTKEKEILTYQFYPFFDVFKKIRWTRLLVIGYSFRDEPINTSIIENMMRIKDSIMIVINPDPDKVLKNLNGRIPDNRVKKITGLFGSDEIRDILNNLPLWIEEKR